MPWTYARGKRYWRQFQPSPLEFNDEFALARGAVLPSPKLCEPGPGSWLVTDLDSRMTQAGDSLVYATGGGGAWDRCMLASTLPFRRQSGQYLEFEFTPTTAAAYFRGGWNFVNAASATGTGANASIQYNEATIYLAGSGMVLVTDGLDVVSPLYPYALGTSTTFRVYDTGTGWLYYVSPTTALPDGWVLLWERVASFTRLSTVIPALNNLSLSGTCGHVRVRQGLVKPPVASVPLPGPGTLLTGAADGLIDAEVTAPASGSRMLVFRASDAANYWYLELDMTAQTQVLHKVVGGVDTVVAVTGDILTPGGMYRLRVLTFGPHIRTFWGIQSGPYTDDPFNQTAALFGNAPPGGASFATGEMQNLRCRSGGRMLLN